MTQDRWEHLWQLFHAALALAPEKRQAWITAETAADPELAAELRSLLKAHEQEHSLLDEPMPDSASNRAGLRVGAWRLLRELGHGGMGVVWLAERADGAYEQQAAVKMLAPVWASPALVNRFAREREILARLHHPNIAVLLDGGTTADGQPYLVMEYVNGVPLHEFCRQRALPLTARLELFLKVCDAVDHAHRQLIVHRDLKPGNVLVTEDGVPKLLDFGIARLRESAREEPVTLPAERHLTPDYASPEQLRGDPVDVTSDGFSLGVILYELLVERRPWRLEGLTVERARAVMERSTPTAPSRVRERGETAVSASTLRGDLDRIVLKAIQHDPELRYPSVREFGADIQRYLAGLPVQARPATWSYRVGKFVRRHPIAVSASATALLVLCLLTTALWRESVRLDAALTQANKQTSRAQALSEFLTGLFLQADPEHHAGDPLEVGTILATGAERVRAAFDGDPTVKATFLTTLGRIHSHLGEFDRAESLLSEALALRERHDGDNHPETALTAAELAQVHELTDRHAEAEALLRRALAILSRTRADPATVRRLRMQLSAALQSQGKLAEAETALRQALADAPHSEPGTGEGWLRLGGLAWGKGDFQAAESHYRQGLAVFRHQHGETSPLAVKALNAVAAAVSQQGDFDTARQLYRETLALRRKIYGPEHPLTAETMAHLGAMLYNAGDYDAAIERSEAALQTQEAVYGPDAPPLANTLNNLALALAAKQEYRQAEQRFDRALRINRAAHGERHHKVAGNLSNLGLVRLEQGRLDEAKSALHEALAIQRGLYSDPHPATAYTLNHLGRAALESGDTATARQWFQEALTIRTTVHSDAHPTVADTLFWMGRLELAQDRPDVAAARLKRSLEIRRAAFGEDDWRSAESTATLGLALAETGDLETGLALMEQGIRQLRAARGDSDPRLAKLVAERARFSDGAASH